MKKLMVISLMIVLACALIVSGCKKGAKEEIRVGVPAPLTGMYAGFGEGYVFGIKAAVEDINKDGGVSVKESGQKLPIKLVIVNTESDPQKGGTLAESLIANDKVHFLASGDEPPPMHAGVSTVADRFKIPYVTSTGPVEPWSGMRQAVEGHWQYTWATGLFAIITPAPAGDFRAKPGYTITDTWQAMLDLFGNKTNKKVAVFASDDPDGVGWYGLFPGYLKQLGYDVCGAQKKVGLAPMETTDFSSVIKQWKDYKCEILWGNAPAPFVGTTPQSLAERWAKETSKQLNRGIGPGYRSIQVLIDAITRAGTLNGEKVNAALAETDLMTIGHRVKFDENHFSRGPLVFGQWQKTDKPWVWECPVVFSKHDFIKATANPIFPIPYK
jgi:branched-chain amino acid transport system substrate-binding protein